MLENDYPRLLIGHDASTFSSKLGASIQTEFGALKKKKKKKGSRLDRA